MIPMPTKGRFLPVLMWLVAIGFIIFVFREPVAAAQLVTTVFQSTVTFLSNLG
ncbi:hypothetical protein [Nonomuraea typhae]|uniref:hypothetical protein n=1 Tax=Nonomuraea typhae TaxID=2603600 RepID=UPI0012FC61A7|nr:hypothetical protein [Nonomuraea typhae]